MDQRDIQPSFYGVIPATVRYDQEVPFGAKILYCEISALCNKLGYCWAQNEYFIKLYGVSESTIKRYIAVLEDKGYLTRQMIFLEGTSHVQERRLFVNDAKIVRMGSPVTPSGVTVDLGMGSPLTPVLTEFNNTKELSSIQNIEDNEKVDTKPPTFASPVKEVFEYWKEKFHKPKYKLNASRGAKINTRLKSFEVDDLKKAIDGVLKSDFHMGREDKTGGVQYIEIETIFRNDSMIDKFMDLADKKILSKHRAVPTPVKSAPCEFCNKGIGPCPAHRKQAAVQGGK